MCVVHYEKFRVRMVDKPLYITEYFSSGVEESFQKCSRKVPALMKYFWNDSETFRIFRCPLCPTIGSFRACLFKKLQGIFQNRWLFFIEINSLNKKSVSKLLEHFKNVSEIVILFVFFTLRWQQQNISLLGAFQIHFRNIPFEKKNILNKYWLHRGARAWFPTQTSWSRLPL